MEECASKPVVRFFAHLVPHLDAEVNKAAQQPHLHHKMILTEMHEV